MEVNKLDLLVREAKGKPVEINGKSLVRLDHFSLPSKKTSLIFTFIETNSEWKQGFILKTQGFFKVNEKKLIENANYFLGGYSSKKNYRGG